MIDLIPQRFAFAVFFVAVNFRVKVSKKSILPKREDRVIRNYSVPSLLDSFEPDSSGVLSSLDSSSDDDSSSELSSGVDSDSDPDSSSDDDSSLPLSSSDDSGADSDVAGAVSSELRSEEHTSELQSRFDLVCRLLLEKK